MKEVKQAKKRQEELLEQIEEQRAFFEELLKFGQGGDSMEKTTIRFQRDALYKEIWDISLSKVAKKYSIPYGKLKEACEKAKIPLPTLSYWSSLQVGKAASWQSQQRCKEVPCSLSHRLRRRAKWTSQGNALLPEKLSMTAKRCITKYGNSQFRRLPKNTAFQML